jgi:hypothetical protein
MSGVYVSSRRRKWTIGFILEEAWYWAIYLLGFLGTAADAACWFLGCPPVILDDGDDYHNFSSSPADSHRKEGYLANLAPIEITAWLLLPFSVGIGWGRSSSEVWGWLALASLVVLVLGAIMHHKLEP